MFMQARTTVVYGTNISKIFADLHERNCNKYYSQSKGELIWVNDYTRDDGTPVKGYYRRK